MTVRHHTALAEAAYPQPAEQVQLPWASPATNSKGRAQTIFSDPGVSDNRSLPVHRWTPWIAGYSASFVDGVISAFLSRRRTGLVLDPFCGVGTTLLQAIKHGHAAVGFELNPYPALAARVKLNAPDIKLAEFDDLLRELRAAALSWKTTTAPESVVIPPLKSRLPFFSPAIHQQVVHLLAFINCIKSSELADLFRVAFGAVMVSFSNYSYEPSLTSRPAAGKSLIEQAEVGQILLAKLQQMRDDIAWLQSNQMKPVGKSRVINSNFFSVDGEVSPRTVDLMITSPPYMNNYHYVRNTRPQLYWLNFISSPIQQKPLETGNFGQYWQTVRESGQIELTFDHSELQQTLARLRETRIEKGAYGGPGWANYVASYFNDCFRFMAQLKPLLARNGVGVIVIGNSIIQGIDIRTESILGEVGAMHGLKLEGIHCIREKRVGASITQSSVRQGERSQAVLSESVVVVKKR